MLPIKEARKALKRTGTSKAQGDALRFMYANLLAFEFLMSSDLDSIAWPIPDLYAHLGTVPDQDIHAESKRIIQGGYAEYSKHIS